MFANKKFFQVFWYFIRLFGLQPYKLNWLQIALALLVFVFLIGVNFVLLLIEIATTTNIATIMSGVQAVPVFVITFLDCLNLVRYSRKIEVYFNNLCRIIDESGEEKLFAKAYTDNMKIMKGLGVFAFISVNSNAIGFLLTGKTITPIWIPPSYLGFLAVWTAQILYINYSIFILWLLESFMFLNFSLLNAYSKAIAKMISEVSLEHEQIANCVKAHLQFIR